jgi:DNA-binding XRE family transcriptional regulator
MVDTENEIAIRAIERAMAKLTDQGAILRLMQAREALMLPMVDVLDRVKGETVAQKAKACGVSRQAFYAWLRGVSRPNKKQARRVAKLTGYKWEDISGSISLSPRQGSLAITEAAAARVRRPKRTPTPRRVKSDGNDLAT